MPLLEVCVDNLAALQAARAGGADRVELCSGLAVGGLTPSASLMKRAACSGMPVRALCRPRPGDFEYSDEELALICDDIASACQAGLEGVVIGAGNRHGLDRDALTGLTECARFAGAKRSRPIGLTLHRVFDLVDDKSTAMELAIELGFDTILTSGGAVTALDGVSTLQGLTELSQNRITILAGSGVDVASVPILAASGIRAFHASCQQSDEQAPDSRLMEFGFAIAPPKRTYPHAVRRLKKAITASSGI